MELVSLYKCMSDRTRLRIINLLLDQGALCVCEIQETIEEAQVKTSKHIGYMKRLGLLRVERRANWNFYEIASDLPDAVQAALNAFGSSSATDPQLATDKERLRESKRAACC